MNVGVTSLLTCQESLEPDAGILGHCDILQRCGAQPVILRCDMDPLHVIEEFDLQGIVFSGGGDVEASRYRGNAELANQGVNRLRDDFEIALMNLAFYRKLPVLAVCRGVQLANVVLGGTLIEDIPTELGSRYTIEHRASVECSLEKREQYAHTITVEQGSLLLEIIGMKKFKVNSRHHQAICRIAAPFRAAAVSDDGIIEAIELKRRNQFFLGVQWHPELLEDPVTFAVFGHLVAASAARKQ